MVEDSQHDAKGAFSKFLYYLIPVTKVLMHHYIVLLVLVIEAIVNEFGVISAHEHHGAVAPATCLCPPLLAVLLLALYDVEEVDCFEFEDLSLLIVP